MSGNTHFTIALHILTLMASHPGEALTSELIAGSVNTNAVFIRRLMASLRRARLVTSQVGAGGGWVLLRNPEGITLLDVYRAMEERELFPLHTSAPNPRCPVGSTIQGVLTRHFQDALSALEENLSRKSIRDMVKEVKSNHR
ncbi:MAG: Rrf2 family transcriptional regulator [Myxococcaceae bacterium]